MNVSASINEGRLEVIVEGDGWSRGFTAEPVNAHMPEELAWSIASSAIESVLDYAPLSQPEMSEIADKVVRLFVDSEPACRILGYRFDGYAAYPEVNVTPIFVRAAAPAEGE